MNKKSQNRRNLLDINGDSARSFIEIIFQGVVEAIKIETDTLYRNGHPVYVEKDGQIVNLNKK